MDIFVKQTTCINNYNYYSMKCPSCSSTNVIENDISIFETDPINMVPEGFDLFAIRSFMNAARNGVKKIDLAINNKKRYLCLDCRNLFEA